jgi:hypothetical protein
MSFGVKESMRQNYSENYFDVGIIAVEISSAGPTTTVIFFSYPWHLVGFAANTMVRYASLVVSMLTFARSVVVIFWAVENLMPRQEGTSHKIICEW